MVSEKIKKIRIKLDSSPILKFVIIFLLIFTFLSMPFEPVKNWYSSGFQSIGNFFIFKFIKPDAELKKRHVEIKLSAQKENYENLKIVVLNTEKIAPDGQVPGRSLNTNAYATGYLPTIFLLSLILSSPVPWKRKRWSLLWGFISVNLLISIRVLCYILDNSNPEFIVYNLSDWLSSIVSFFNSILSLNTGIGANLAIVVFIWIITTFRFKDIEYFKKIFV